MGDSKADLVPLPPLGAGIPSIQATTPPTTPPAGFVTARGTEFWLDGRPYRFAGMNAYWIPQLVHESQYDAAFQRLKDIGVRVLRTWAFSMVEGELPTTNLTYFQYWKDGEQFLNVGANGLARLDTTVKYAAKYGIKLIMVFVNNWEHYGAMDVYTSNLVGKDACHSDFYTNAKVIAAFEAYVHHIVTRYKDSASIFAWELTNEARATATEPLKRLDFTPGDLTRWVADRAAFIKRLDPHHMVAVGDEGFFNWDRPKTKAEYVYSGESGGDFDAYLKLGNIDFGTFHMYPETWGMTPELEWGKQWIQEHIDSMNRHGKPVVFEEFNIDGYDKQTTMFPAWIELAEEQLPGIMPWGLAANDMDISDTTVWLGSYDETNDFWPGKDLVWAMLQQMGKRINEKWPLE